MSCKKFRNLHIALILVGLSITALVILQNSKVQFLLGGAFINIGYRFQDHILDPSSTSDSELNVLAKSLFDQNALASKVRSVFPRSIHHPKIALLTCMDARLDTVEITGDTRRHYYTIRSAGSALQPIQQEMLELAVKNGVKLLVLTTHTDCAAERIAKDSKLKMQFPEITHAVLNRDAFMSSFLSRPTIAKKIFDKQLKIIHAVIETATGKMNIKVNESEDSPIASSRGIK